VYASLLKDQFEESIPFDVTFEIVEKGENDNEENDKREEVKAHKMILATFSSVFRAMFFGPMKESKDVIPIKDTTVEAFKKMIDYFYQVDIDCREIELVKLFDIVNLAERYNVPMLKEEMKEQVEKVPITMENLMEVAAIASQFSHFEDISSALLLNCAKVFQKEVNTSDDQIQFILDQQARGEFAVNYATNILALSKTLPPLGCENCKNEKCLDGQPVEHAKLEKGLKVKVDTSFTAAWGIGGGAYAARRYIVENVRGSSNEAGLKEEGNFKTVIHNRSTLCYRCTK